MFFIRKTILCKFLGCSARYASIFDNYIFFKVILGAKKFWNFQALTNWHVKIINHSKNTSLHVYSRRSFSKDTIIFQNFSYASFFWRIKRTSKRFIFCKLKNKLSKEVIYDLSLWYPFTTLQLLLFFAPFKIS